MTFGGRREWRRSPERSVGYENPADVLGDADRLLAAFDLDDELRRLLEPAAADLVDGQELDGAPAPAIRPAPAPGSGPCSSRS